MNPKLKYIPTHLLATQVAMSIGCLLSIHAHAESALIETSMGTITVALDAKSAPASVANFIEYAQSGHYDGTQFHRVIPNFMIQGGGFDARMNERPTRPPIFNEATNGLKNTAYTLAMARTGVVHSATSQFFINVADNDFLNHQNVSTQGYGYAVFGKVTAGFKIVDAIAKVKTSATRYSEAQPLSPILIKHVRIIPD